SASDWVVRVVSSTFRFICSPPVAMAIAGENWGEVVVTSVVVRTALAARRMTVTSSQGISIGEPARGVTVSAWGPNASVLPTTRSGSRGTASSSASAESPASRSASMTASAESSGRRARSAGGSGASRIFASAGVIPDASISTFAAAAGSFGRCRSATRCMVARASRVRRLASVPAASSLGGASVAAGAAEVDPQRLVGELRDALHQRLLGVQRAAPGAVGGVLDLLLAAEVQGDGDAGALARVHVRGHQADLVRAAAAVAPLAHLRRAGLTVRPAEEDSSGRAAGRGEDQADAGPGGLPPRHVIPDEQRELEVRGELHPAAIARAEGLDQGLLVLQLEHGTILRQRRMRRRGSVLRMSVRRSP